MNRKLWVGLGLLLLMVAGHELTHVTLNNFRVNDFCFLNCREMATLGVTGNGYTPIGVYLKEPINPMALNEGIAHLVSLNVVFWGLTLVYYVERKQQV